MTNRKSYTVALGGIMVAISVVAIYIASFIPGIEMTALAVTSLATAIMVVEVKAPQTFIMVAAVALISFAIVPNKLVIVPYLCLFGSYPIFKFYAEKPKKILKQILVKLGIFAVIFSVSYFLLKPVFFQGLPVGNMGLAALLVGSILFFAIYDTVLTLLIHFYIKRLKRGNSEIQLTKK